MTTFVSTHRKTQLKVNYSSYTHPVHVVFGQNKHKQKLQTPTLTLNQYYNTNTKKFWVQSPVMVPYQLRYKMVPVQYMQFLLHTHKKDCMVLVAIDSIRINVSQVFQVKAFALQPTSNTWKKIIKTRRALVFSQCNVFELNRFSFVIYQVPIISC